MRVSSSRVESWRFDLQSSAPPRAAAVRTSLLELLAGIELSAVALLKTRF